MIDRRVDLQHDVTGPEKDSEAPKRAWVKPQLVRMVAGSAEAGPNPSRPEGQFAQGGS